MKRLFRVGAGSAAVVIGLAGFVATGATAGAATPPGYTLQSSSVALKISLAGTTLTAGTSSASAGSSTSPQAQGTGELSPAAVSSQQATATAPGTSQTLPSSCAQPTVPFPAPLGSLLSLGAACSSASAAEGSTGLPTATSTGQLSTVGVSPSATALPVPVTLKSTLATTLGSILGTLPPTLKTTTHLDTVLVAVAEATGGTLTTLVNANVGSSTSSVSATATSATAKGGNSGTQISLLGGIGLGGAPLLTVTLGQALTTVTVDRTTGQVTATDTPAVATVTLNSPVGGTQSFSVAPGVSQTFLSGTPLATTVDVGSGSATPGSGKGSATADGVTIDALQGLGATTLSGTNGGLDIDLASATSSVTATVPVAAVVATTPPPAPAPAPAVVTGATTVHTGEFWSGPLPILLLGLAMLTGLGLIARRRLLLAAHHVTRLARGGSDGASPGPASGTSSVPPPVPGPARRQSH